MRTRVRLRRQASKTDAGGKGMRGKTETRASITGRWVFLLRAINVALGKSYSRVSVCLSHGRSDSSSFGEKQTARYSKFRNALILPLFLSLFFRGRKILRARSKVTPRKRSCFRRVKAERLSSVLTSELFP